MEIRPDTRSSSITLTEKCNLNCIFCGAKVEGTHKLSSRKLTDEITFLKSHEIDHLVLIGGEPTLSEHLLKILTFAKERSISHVDLHTNGLMFVYPDFLKKLESAGLESVRFFFISHDRDNYDSFTRTSGLFNSLIKAIDNAAGASFDIEFAVPVFRKNLDTVVGTIDYILSKWPEAGGLFLVPVGESSPEIHSPGDVEKLKIVLTESTRMAVDVGVSLHYNFWEPVRSELKHLAHPDTKRYLAHETDCYNCSIVSGCNGARLSGDRFLSESIFTNPESARDLYVSRTGDPGIDIKNDIIYSEMERKSIFSFYRPDHSGSDHLHQVILRANFICNQKCPFCYNEATAEFEARRSEIEYMIGKINEAFKTVDRFSFSGGEPTLDENLERYIRMVKNGPARKIELQTNAVRLANTDYASKLIASGVDTAFVSLHAHEPALSATITGRKGNFEKALAGIDNLLAGGVHVDINHVINTLNYTRLPEFVRFAHSRFSNSPIVFSMAHPFKWFPDSRMKYVPRFLDFAGYLGEALEWCLETGARFSGLAEPCGIPLCILGGEKKYYGEFHEIPAPGEEDYIVDREFIKPEVCRECDLFGNCFGIRARYAQYYGTDELRPVRIATD